ncbi:MAG: hypothetical protein ACHQUB_02400 [Candidatus Saccharimonadia bacterium]
MATVQKTELQRQIPQIITLVVIVLIIIVLLIGNPFKQHTKVKTVAPATLDTSFDLNALPALELRSTSYPVIVPDDLGGRANPFAP